MSENEITFHNNAAIKVQAQIYNGRTLVSTCMAASGEVHQMAVASTRYDIFFKDGATGWVIARLLNSEIKSFTLSHLEGRYTIT